MPALDHVDPTRRTVLRGVAAVGGIAVAGGALAACGGGSDSSADKSSTSDTPSSDTPTSDSPAPSSTSETSKAPSGKNVGPASAIAVGGGKIFASQKVVVTQPTAGDFKAFSAVCTHMGCTVSQIVENTIVCPCHGSEYSFEDGSVIKGPATKPLAKKKVTESGGDITVT